MDSHNMLFGANKSQGAGIALQSMLAVMVMINDHDVDGGDDEDDVEDGVEVVGLARQAKRISGLCLL